VLGPCPFQDLKENGEWLIKVHEVKKDVMTSPRWSCQHCCLDSDLSQCWCVHSSGCHRNWIFPTDSHPLCCVFGFPLLMKLGTQWSAYSPSHLTLPFPHQRSSSVKMFLVRQVGLTNGESWSPPSTVSLIPEIYEFKCMSYFWILRPDMGEESGLIKHKKVGETFSWPKEGVCDMQ
jgi:hypothetical protein